ncbi:efflux RND transporter periplasmic adaptor subunit [Paenibacillus sp.]|uniref:efflux RND transporter periplasmic adaptor subunit n=1 Tax=Paenibacillus sp. TaxID=58172 RepID=UPI002D715590|nr:efflux RND transporter periplasmic adaptor subunit [Paenibacillus sp.]HZG85642.1 efflux RND transporter periplasmic adaptor subunit [Paenibacillus sp.]
MRRALWVLSLFAGVALFATACSQGEEPAQSAEAAPEAKKVKAEPAGTVQIGRAVTVAGVVKSAVAVQIVSEIGGIVEAKPLEAGDEVGKDGVLLELEKDQYELTLRRAEVAKERAALTSATSETDRRNAVLNAEGAVAKAQLNVDQLQKEYDRLESLLARDAVSAAEVERAANQLAAAKLDLDSARRGLEQAKSSSNERLLTLGVKEAEVAYQEALMQYGKTTIRSPIAGIVTASGKVPGQTVQPGEAVAVVEDFSRMSLTVSVTEADFLAIRGKESLTVSVPALRRTVEASVASLAASSVGAGEGFSVELELPNEDRAILPGMNAEVVLNDAGAGETLVVPAGSVLEESGESFVFAVREGQARRTPVEVGRVTKAHAEIVSGLAAGDLVVTVGQGLLKDGDAVEVVE